MQQYVKLLFALVMVTVLSMSGASAARHALVIGNAAYDELTDLRNTHNDAEAYHSALQNLGFKSTLKKDLDFDSTLDALDELLETVRSGDQVAFVYSGHGWSDGLNNFLSPTDSPISGSDRRLKRSSIPLSNGFDGILDELRNAGVSLTFAVIDACRNNPFTPLPGKKSAGISRGLARIQNQQGSFVVFSAGAGQEALDRVPSDDADQKLSVFSRHFIPKLEAGMYLEDAISEAQVETHNLALTYQGHQQLPIYEDGTLGKTCLSGDCEKPKPKRPGEDVAVLLPRVEPRLTLDQQMARSIEVQNCDQAAGSRAHPDYVSGKVLVDPTVKSFHHDGRLGVSTCTVALAEFPNHPRLLANLASSYEFIRRPEKAVKIYQSLVESGDMYAHGKLANYYLLGGVGGIERNKKRGIELLEKAVEAGDSDSQRRLALVYLTGSYYAKNEAKGLELLRLSADQKNGDAQYSIGSHYQFERENYQEAARWYQKAMTNGSILAQINLARIYRSPKSGMLNYVKAFRLYQKAYDSGHEFVIAPELADMYAKGQGTTVDHWTAARLHLSGLEYEYGSIHYNSLLPETIKAMQQQLFNRGLYRGVVDGKLNQATKAALDKIKPR